MARINIGRSVYLFLAGGNMPSTRRRSGFSRDGRA